jgi:hypothetical protein
MAARSKILRIDFIFSYWIFAWFILYWIVLNLPPSATGRAFLQYNPLFVLIFALFENIGFFILLLWGGYKNSLYFIFIMFFIKIAPIYILWGRRPIHWTRDLAATGVLFCAYTGWLYYNKITPLAVYKKIFNYIALGENKTPFIAALQWLNKLKPLQT